MAFPEVHLVVVTCHRTPSLELTAALDQRCARDREWRVRFQMAGLELAKTTGGRTAETPAVKAAELGVR